MADWGILSALSGVNNWNAIRAEKQRELQLVALQNAMMEQEQQKQLQSGAAVEEYLQTVSKIKALEPDMARIKTKNTELVKEIQEGVKNSEGNVKKYLLGGGINALNKYRQTLLDSEEVQTGLMNAFNHNRYIADVQAGMTPRSVSWTDNTGADVEGDYATQFNEYNKGNVRRLNYQGAYKRPQYDAREHFAKFYGNDRYKQQPVGERELFTYIFEAAKKDGLSDRDATAFAVRETKIYGDQTAKGMTPFYFKYDDPLAKQEKLSRIGYYNAKTAAVKAAQEGVSFYSMLLNSNQETQPIVLADNAKAPTPVKSIYGDGHLYNYNLPSGFASTFAQGQGYMLDKGKIVNKSNISNQASYTMSGRRLDFSNVGDNEIVSAEPIPTVVDLTVGGDNKMKGMVYRIRINEKGAEKLKWEKDKGNMVPWEGVFANEEDFGVKRVGGSEGQGDKLFGVLDVNQPYDANDHVFDFYVVQQLSPSTQAHFAIDKGVGITSPFNQGRMTESVGYQNTQLYQSIFSDMEDELNQ